MTQTQELLCQFAHSKYVMKKLNCFSSSATAHQTSCSVFGRHDTSNEQNKHDQFPIFGKLPPMNNGVPSFHSFHSSFNNRHGLFHWANRIEWTQLCLFWLIYLISLMHRWLLLSLIFQSGSNLFCWNGFLLKSFRKLIVHLGV